MKLELDTKRAYEIGSFASYFKALIGSGPYTQREIAHHLGVSTRSISNYLAGERIPGISMCEQIAFLFGVSIAEVRAAAGKPLPTSIDSIFDKRIRSLMLGMDWTPRRLEELTEFLSSMEYEQEREREKSKAHHQTGSSSPSGRDDSGGTG